MNTFDEPVALATTVFMRSLTASDSVSALLADIDVDTLLIGRGQ